MEGIPTITGDQLECIICTEIPIKVLETECCGTIIWEEWAPKIDKCPNRWESTAKKLGLNHNKFIQRMINHIKVAWPYCKEEFSRSDILNHKDDCDQNLLKPVLMNQALHSWCLYRTKKHNSWFCDGLKLINHGWAASGTEKKVTTHGESWYCSRWDIDYCENCILAYGGNTDESDLKAFPKDGMMHLTHPHPMKMYFGSNLPEQGRKNWYGNYKTNGWSGDYSDKLRYLVCYDCKLILWEKCFFSPSEEFLLIEKSVHKHMVHLQSIPSTFTWGCDVKSPNCIKKDHATNKNCRISYRCDWWDFDICSEWLKSSKV